MALKPLKKEKDGKEKAEPYFEYKDPASLTRFLMEGGKIVPARISKLSLKHQKQLNQAIKRARNLALLPLGSLAYDYHNRVDMISPVPFEL